MALRKKPAGKPSQPAAKRPVDPKVKVTLGVEDPAPVSLTALRRRGRR